MPKQPPKGQLQLVVDPQTRLIVTAAPAGTPPVTSDQVQTALADFP